ncbi:hypothetical protein DXA36_16075 [Eisenbergiella sp. OF01-20]|nr:hypothetical protein DXA36_16075 [Eisenbergiella sp. OF01-20]
MALESFPIIIQPDRDVNYICNENLTFRNRSDGPLCPAASRPMHIPVFPGTAALHGSFQESVCSKAAGFLPSVCYFLPSVNRL